MSVYAVPQVIAAAFPVSQLSGEVATLVKLTRVMLRRRSLGHLGRRTTGPAAVVVSLALLAGLTLVLIRALGITGGS